MKGVTEIPGLRDIRKMHSVARSIPRLDTSAFLDLYILGKEKERLQREAVLLEKRHGAIRKRLGDIRRQTERLKGAAQTAPPSRDGDKPVARNQTNWKTFALRY